jgi:crotonobetainyl-CoA:carnitine CoA-transferase CaiB-like acyl-CoA transferase
VSSPEPAGPLAGLTVIELATTVMAPYAGQLLGDMGAEVVKIEGFEGDPNRSMAGGGHPELSGVALNLHRNKRSIALDLKLPAGREIALRLAAEADVFVTNMRPSALERLGLDYESVRAVAPRIVYAEAHGYLIESGKAAEPSYDDTIQSLTGLPRLSEQVGTGVFFPPMLIADKVSGLHIVQGVLAALVRRGITGEGQRVEIPMFNSVLAFVLTEHIGLAAFPGGPAGYSRILTANRGPHKTADGWLALMPYLDRHWKALFTEAGCEELLDSPWHADMVSRLREADTVYGELKTVVARRTTAEWLETCRRLDVPVAEVPTLDDIVNDEARHHGVLSLTEHPVVGTHRSIASPIRYYGTPVPAPKPAPLIGEDGETILDDLGYSGDDIAALVDEGVLRLPSNPSKDGEESL